MSENFRGALIMMVCMSAFVLNDAFVRMAGNSLPLAQILFLRGLITTIVLLAFAIYGGVFSSKVSKKDKWHIFFRSIAEALTSYFFLTAVMNMPFANVTSILQILPMTVTLAAAFVFKEKVGIIRITLILLGFFGVVLIIIFIYTHSCHSWLIQPKTVDKLISSEQNLQPRLFCIQIRSMYKAFRKLVSFLYLV